MRMLVLGPPGSGKGTQAAILSEELGIPHISTGEMFREAIKNGSELGLLAQGYIRQGDLVPNDITVALVKERLSKEDCQEGYLLDGFPRTVEQGESFDKILSELGQELDRVIYLEVPRQALIRRLTARRVCGICGAVYNLENKPPVRDELCDRCGGQVGQREDDREETVLNRLDVYNRVTRPLADFYQAKDLLCTITGDLSIKVTADMIRRDCVGEAYSD